MYVLHIHMYVCGCIYAAMQLFECACVCVPLCVYLSSNNVSTSEPRTTRAQNGLDSRDFEWQTFYAFMQVVVVYINLFFVFFFFLIYFCFSRPLQSRLTADRCNIQ